MKEKEISVDLSTGPDPMPKEGDTVNHVQEVNKIVPAVIVSVLDKNEGRTITVKNPDPKGKEAVIRLTHRPRAALAGNTWHWPAKAAAMILVLLTLGLCLTALANIPTYHTASAYGNSAAPATVIFPADPNSQIRIVTIQYTCDSASGQLLFTSGGTAYSLIQTNPASFTTNAIDSTNGLFVGQAILQHFNGVDYTNNVTGWGMGTNIAGSGTTNTVPYLVTGSGFAVQTTVGDEIYMMTNGSSWYAGVTTNTLSGDDIYNGNYGRPVELQLGPTTTTNRLSNVSAHYDSASQP